MQRSSCPRIPGRAEALRKLKRVIASIIPDWPLPEILSHNSMSASWQHRWKILVDKGRRLAGS